MSGTVAFFVPVDTLDLNALLGIQEEAEQWEIQDNSPTRSKDRASGLDRYGDEKGWKEHNLKESRTLVYECQKEHGLLLIPAAGHVTAGGHHIDSVGVEYTNAGWPKLTIVTHRHTGVTGSHVTGGCRTYTATLKLPAQFGIPSVLVDKTLPDGIPQFSLESPAAALRSLGYSLSVQHVDEPGGTGEWFAGENRDGSETLSVGFLGKPEDAEITVGADWGTPSDAEKDSNTSSSSRTLSLVRHIKKD